MGLCKDCKWWQKYEQKKNFSGARFGTCLRTNDGLSSSTTEIVFDADDNVIAHRIKLPSERKLRQGKNIRVSPDFGCIQFEPKTEGAPDA